MGGSGEGGGVSTAPGSAVLSMQCGKIFQHTLLHMLGLKDSTLHRMYLSLCIKGSFWARIWAPRPCWDPEHKVTAYASTSLCSEEQLLVSQEVLEKQAFRAGSGWPPWSPNCAHHPQRYWILVEKGLSNSNPTRDRDINPHQSQPNPGARCFAAALGAGGQTHPVRTQTIRQGRQTLPLPARSWRLHSAGAPSVQPLHTPQGCHL